MKKIICLILISLMVFSSFGMLTFAQTQESKGTENIDIPSVGAIRWDAWTAHTNKGWDVISQVEKTLSPSQFHFRAPFFAKVTADNKIIIPAYNQEIFDQEMQYAKYAGIDYFAYIWYFDDAENNPGGIGMQQARKFHQTSKYRNDVKMCVIDPAINDESIAEMSELLTSDYYMTVLDGRPLMYYRYTQANEGTIREKINTFKELAQSLGIPEPYAVVMNVTPVFGMNINGDAVSKYAIDGTQLTYKELTQKAVDYWNSTYRESKKYSFPFVPTVTYGWQPEPRYINPVTWMSVSDKYWCDYATDVELLDHLAYAMSYVQHPSVKPYCEANTVIAYAWNEHDEGGWICPTLEVDENGNQLYNEDGTKKINERRINATKAAIDYIKGGNLVNVTVDGVSNGSTVMNASDDIENVNDVINDNVLNGIGEFQGATLNIGTSLTMSYFVKNLVNVEDLSMRFTTPSGYSVISKGSLDKTTGYAKFDYTGINPQCMADEITAELLYKGRTVKTYGNYSVKQYCENMASKSKEELKLTDIQYNALKTLLADILHYGKTAQIYKDYNTDNLADASSFVEENKSTFTVPEGVKVISGNKNTQNFVKSASLNMSNVNKIYFRMMLGDDNVLVKLNGQDVDKTKLIKQTDGTYVLYTDEILATEFDKVFTLELILDDKVITEVRYNVNAYIQGKYNNASVGDLVKGLSQYGLSTQAYQASFEGDGDMTFGDEEILPTIKPDKDMTLGDEEKL